MQGIGDQPAGQHVLDGDGRTHLRRRIAHRMLARADRHRGEVLGGGAVLVHVRLGNQRVIARHRRTVGTLELRVAGGRLHRQGLLARHAGTQAVGHRDHDRVAEAALYRRGRLVQRSERRATAGANAHAVAREDLQVLRDRFGVVHVGLGHRVAGDDPVDLVLADARVRKRAQDRLDAQLGRAHVLDDAHLGVGGAHDRSPATQRAAHRVRPSGGGRRRCPAWSPRPSG